MAVAATFSDAQPFYDVCIVGSGPAGLAAALACEKRGLSVLLLERGSSEPAAHRTTPYDDDLAGEDNHAPLDVGSRSAFGGTSWAWGGLCMPLDRLDLQPRRYIAHSGWPIEWDELASWLRPAAAFLGCGAPDFQADELIAREELGVSAAGVGRIPAQPNLALIYRAQIERSDNIFCCLNAPVTRLNLSADGKRVTGLRIARRANAGRLPRVGVFVLAAGGIETTRILLATQRQHPHLCGGQDGPLGRFYMGHIAGQIASIVFQDPAMALKFLYRRLADGNFVQRRLKIREDMQKREGLLNTDFIVRLPPAADCRHRSGALSLLHLMSRTPAGALFRDSKKLQYVLPMFGGGRVSDHLRNIFLNPRSVIADAGNLLTQFRRRHLPVLFPNAGDVYSLRYHAEQIPEAESRIALRGEAGRALTIDLRHDPADISSVVKAHGILDRALRAAGIGHLEFYAPITRCDELVLAQASDGYHQIGSTRMGDDPGNSVVDADCRVHGVENLYIASSSTFPTSGAANPTFTAVCLALRLARHLGLPENRARHAIAGRTRVRKTAAAPAPVIVARNGKPSSA